MNQFQIEWKKLASSKAITAADMATLALSKAARKENPEEWARIYLKKSFTPTTNPKKLRNGARPYYALEEALFYIEKSKAYAAFSPLWSEETRTLIGSLKTGIRPGWKRIDL